MKRVPPEAISDLRRRLSPLAPRSAERRPLVTETAGLYGVSTDTLYRALRERAVPTPLRRSDHGVPRVMPAVWAKNLKLDVNSSHCESIVNAYLPNR
jgi:hypothetical protein